MESWNYKMIKRDPPSLKRHDDLPEGWWMPVSKAARIKGFSPNTLRLRFFKGKIRAYKVRNGPMLVDLTEIN